MEDILSKLQILLDEICEMWDYALTKIKK